MAKIEIGGMMQCTGLVQMGVMSVPDRPGVAGTMFSALGERGINVLAISTSISTLSCVIDADRLCDAVAAIQETFHLP